MFSKSLSLFILLVSVSSTGYGIGYLQKDYKTDFIDSKLEMKRPFRAGFLKLAPSFDDKKPLGISDYAGWASTADLIIGAVDENWVGAFNSKDGSPVWWLKIDADLTSPVFVAGSWVIIGTRDGSLVKVESTTGKVVWRVNLDSFPSRKLHLTGASLLVVTASQHLYSVDFKQGKVNWLFDGGFPQGLTIRSLAAPIAFNNIAYFGVSTGEIVAVALDSGKLEWRYNPEFTDDKFHDYVGEMVVVNSKLLMTRYDGLIGAISLSTPDPKVLWSHRLPSISHSVFRGGRFFVGSVNGDLNSFEGTNGKRLWRSRTGSTVSQMTAGEQMIYVAGSEGEVTMLDSSKGKTVWVDFLEARISSPMFYVGSDIYFATGAKNLYGYRIQ